MSESPLFESLEGLRGTGKSTIAPLLAQARGAVVVPTVPASFRALRQQVDMRENVEARMCFYLSALFTAADEVQRHLDAGTSVVVESYFARCLATHRAIGARLDVTLPAHLQQPTTYQLTCTEDERQRRLLARDKRISPWDVLSEVVPDRITRAYARFPMRRIETTGLAPGQVVDTILASDTEGVRRGDAEPLGAHPHVLPSVPGLGDRARSR
ncbi:hypothetical protein ACFYWY_08865 [Streptomyces sp. NPDC002870]|uniref:AAA family ATPase n=1 Tax=Streptomyces sp. NPDC002870 TaxID=3364666 RepID=UPI00367AA3C3